MVGFSRLTTAELLLSVVLLGISARISPAAFRAVRPHGARARAAFWLSLGSTVASALIALVAARAVVSGFRHTCLGPVLACAGAALMLLASFIAWPPWRPGPRRLQLAREVHVALWWCATLSIYLVCRH